jgi:hypothetical protein
MRVVPAWVQGGCSVESRRKGFKGIPGLKNLRDKTEPCPLRGFKGPGMGMRLTLAALACQLLLLSPELNTHW